VTDADPATTGRDGEPGEAEAPRFAHASEAEMARILDFYDVRWDYEPVTFPILWNLEGDVLESFAPDFYLPELDVFLEMTTLKQRLVRKKNRKLRRLRELYPDIRIKLFYARDFRAMMLKYGRLGLVESLSGTPGQVVPERPGPAAGVEAARAARTVHPPDGEVLRPTTRRRRRADVTETETEVR
jgi:hypoxanthine phosphoribosyltransferase